MNPLTNQKLAQEMKNLKQKLKYVEKLQRFYSTNEKIMSIEEKTRFLQLMEIEENIAKQLLQKTLNQ